MVQLTNSMKDSSRPRQYALGRQLPVGDDINRVEVGWIDAMGRQELSRDGTL